MCLRLATNSTAWGEHSSAKAFPDSALLEAATTPSSILSSASLTAFRQEFGTFLYSGILVLRIEYSFVIASVLALL